MTNPFGQPLGPGKGRIIQGSSGTARSIESLEQEATVARLEGTGKDPLGRYNEGEVFDVPRYTGATMDNELAEPVENPVYRELIENGWAKPVPAEKDPGRTVSQIADAKVSQVGGLVHPVDAKLAASMSDEEARAIVHTGDPNAAFSGKDHLEKPRHVREAQSDAVGQGGQSPAFLGQAQPDGGQAQRDAIAQAGGGDAGQGKSDQREDDEFDKLTGDDLTNALRAAKVQGYSSMTADEQRDALRKAKGGQS